MKEQKKKIRTDLVEVTILGTVALPEKAAKKPKREPLDEFKGMSYAQRKRELMKRYKQEQRTK